MILEGCPEYTQMELKRLGLWNKNGDSQKTVDKCKELENTPIHSGSKLQFYLGQAYYYIGKTEAGKKVWRNILSMDPDCALAAKAIKSVKKSDEIKEEGNQLFKEKKFDEALVKYEESASIDPYNRNFNALVYGNISSLYLKQGEKEKALKAMMWLQSQASQQKPE